MMLNGIVMKYLLETFLKWYWWLQCTSNAHYTSIINDHFIGIQRERWKIWFIDSNNRILGNGASAAQNTAQFNELWNKN